MTQLSDLLARIEAAEGLETAWLLNYRPLQQNGVYSAVETVWTRHEGTSRKDLQACVRAGLVTSCPDDVLHRGGWRHDLTPGGRSAIAILLRALESQHDRSLADTAERVEKLADRLHNGLSGGMVFGLTAKDLRALLALVRAGQALAVAAGPFAENAAGIHTDWSGVRRRSSLTSSRPLTVGNFRDLASALTAFEKAGKL